MGLAKRDLIAIEDLSNQEIEAVFSLADELSESIKKQTSLCAGLIMATLFYEPSTRTRLSFESAMHRLGGRVISCADMEASSAAKGESIGDTARVIGNYADIIVIRHPWEGAAKIVADYTDVPVINAGDGGHEHPTQTLCDLYTLKKEKGSIKGLTVALWGDLKYGRTVHSLAYGLAKFGARILCRPIEGLEMPEYVTRRIQSEYDCDLIPIKADDMQSLPGKVDALYINPPPHQLTLFPSAEIETFPGIDTGKELSKIDALYVTRVQKERHTKEGDSTAVEESYPAVNKKFLRDAKLKDTVVMHPLPRVNELDYALDKDPRSVYFEQAARGVPIRMALITLLLGAKEIAVREEDNSLTRKANYPRYKKDFGVRCQNPSCASLQERRYITPEFKIVARQPLRLRCVYCEREQHPQYVASSKWHQGILENKRYYSSDSFMVERIKQENLIIFGSETEAQAQGFRPGKYLAACR